MFCCCSCGSVTTYSSTCGRCGHGECGSCTGFSRRAFGDWGEHDDDGEEDFDDCYDADVDEDAEEVDSDNDSDFDHTAVDGEGVEYEEDDEAEDDDWEYLEDDYN